MTAINTIRIVCVPVTHDEGLTFNCYTPLSYKNIANCANPTANNHILNTIFTKFITGHTTPSPFFLRLDNLLAQLLFLLFSYLLARLLFKNKWWGAAAFLLLNLDPFLFQFWGVCRGYGLAIAFMMGSIFFLFSYIKNGKASLFALSILLGMLAVYSNFTLLLFFAGIFIANFFNSFLIRKPIQYKTVFLKELPLAAIATIVLYIMIAPTIHGLEKGNQLYYGGDTGFITDTVRSLISDCFFIDNTENKFVAALACMVALSIVIAGAYWLWLYLKKKDSETIRWGILSWLLLAVPVFCIIAEHWLWGTKLLISRTALFLLPLYMIHFCCFINTINMRVAPAILLVATVIAIVNFAIHLNFTTISSWTYDRYDMQVMKRMYKESKNKPGRIRVRPFWLFAPAFQYYATALYSDKFYAVDCIREEYTGDTTYDFYYVLKADISKIPAQYTVDTLYEDFVLLRK